MISCRMSVILVYLDKIGSLRSKKRESMAGGADRAGGLCILRGRGKTAGHGIFSTCAVSHFLV